MVPALRYVQAAKPESVSQVSEPVTCGATGELAYGVSDVGLLMCGSRPVLQNEVMPIVVRELVLAEILPIPRIFCVDCSFIIVLLFPLC